MFDKVFCVIFSVLAVSGFVLAPFAYLDMGGTVGFVFGMILSLSGLVSTIFARLAYINID